LTSKSSVKQMTLSGKSKLKSLAKLAGQIGGGYIC
jgi:hypothetical protein